MPKLPRFSNVIGSIQARGVFKFYVSSPDAIAMITRGVIISTTQAPPSGSHSCSPYKKFSQTESVLHYSSTNNHIGNQMLLFSHWGRKTLLLYEPFFPFKIFISRNNVFSGNLKQSPSSTENRILPQKCAILLPQGIVGCILYSGIHWCHVICSLFTQVYKTI